MNITFSRHAKRRMKLYDITESDVITVIKNGTKEALPDGRITMVLDLGEKFRYPIKVIGFELEETFKIVTTYPFKKGEK